MMMMMLSQVVTVQRQKLAACMTCPLCNKLFRDATTISECLHTFCRKCIYKKITDEELDTCPVCDINLGSLPLEKLRADHSLQDLRTKVFPSKRQRDQAPKTASSVLETMPSVPLSGRRKERSLSSLVVCTPKVSTKPLLTRKRLKSIARQTPLRESIVHIEEPVKKVDDWHESLSSPETLNKIAQSKRPLKKSCTAESSKQHMTDKDAEDIGEPFEGKADLWKPLTCLVEAVSKTKYNKSNPQETVVQIEKPNAREDEDVHKINIKVHGNKVKVNGDENNSTPSPSGSVKPRRLQAMQPKKAACSERMNVPAQAFVDTNSKYDGRFRPIWFSLIASDAQEGDASLPQISSCYLRVKDGSLPVSSIKKYLVQKLGLTSEAEVEISLRGQPVVSTLQLHNLVDWWVQMAPANERIQTTVGSSGKDFVMVLSYGRTAQPP